VVTNLSTEAFLAAFDRFFARRGLPNDIFSDRGNNFVGVDRQMRMMIETLKVKRLLPTHGLPSYGTLIHPVPRISGFYGKPLSGRQRILVRVIVTHVFTYTEDSPRCWPA